MRIHANQINPVSQLDALYAAGKAAAKQEAARTRKKLLDSAAELEGEAASGDFVVRLGAREESEDAGQRKNQNPSRKKSKQAKGAEIPESTISDWA